MLGDLDPALVRVDALPSHVSDAEARVTIGLVERLDALQAQLDAVPSAVDAAAERLSQVASARVEEFIEVANEALAKFIQRTNEIKAALEVLESKVGATPIQPPPAALAPSAPDHPGAITVHDRHTTWTLIYGVMAGIAIGATAVGFAVTPWPNDPATVKATSPADGPGVASPSPTPKLNRTGRGEGKAAPS
ncbi:hypothetical protein [Variovorax saccharolyticus]|uniref:hypothetical protein n=1 Tax=Variovorax saccharolyticus TaxID=3053516 RepID=UPI002577813A|nr:hypothetical protein [Variovorax sp. J31P216]MDM0029884.1 hypothetical protein [Variovorax sp. J31P216]